MKRVSRWRKPVTGTPSDDLLSSRFARGRRHQHQEQAVEKALRESGGSAPTNDKSRAKLPGDRDALRGIPVQFKGVGTTMRGTNPSRELLRKQPKDMLDWDELTWEKADQ